MCLSTVYKNNEDPNNILMNNVARIEIKGDSVLVTDFLERQLEVPGELLSLDLMSNKAIIRTSM